ncbi:TetR/AcrR family transcriptional regulator [Halocynthiibacter sp. C4]|uniref:TetR/AcrR family transcriptional regulator n=1 Tax=Halocynthiibacter sp. C4 TaxID=2992758 RepID=UPI00237BE424|nr:TetR/AcrR family transcriptional regulator [Halocynthiibacter sp. C4]MDE0588374.1 TetR/AcrR family transcriptional regulator [Halocynthiibacter sp. C4]
MTALTDVIKRGRKFDQVLEGAKTVFLRDGFEGASVDDIAREAGVSKATLYSYFPDKRLLFAKIAEIECLRQAEIAEHVVDFASPPRAVLTEVGNRVLSFVTSDFGIAIFKICVSENSRFPAIGRQFYESGPALARERLSTYLQVACDRGDLEIDDIPFAAEQFLELNKSFVFPRLLCGVQASFNHEERDKVVNGAVDMFLARYGAHGES